MRRLCQLLTLLSLMLSARVAFAQNDYTTTPNLALKLPKIGSTNAGVYINGDFTTLDAAVGQFHGGFVVTPFSATPIFNLASGNTFQLTLTGNVTSSAVNQPGVTAGQFLYLIVCQDSAGSRTFTFPTSFQTPLPTISPTPSKCSASTWVWSASFSAWINTGGSSGGGGGATPAPPAFSIQKADAGATSLAASSILDNGSTVTVSEPVSLASTLGVTGAITAAAATFSGTLTANSTIVSNAHVSSSANPAASGIVRLATGDQVCWRNFANGADVCLSKDASDVLSYAGVLSATAHRTASANPSLTGVLRLSTGDAIGWRNFANGADLLLSKNASDQLVWPNALSLGSGGLLLAGASSGTATLISLAAGGGTHTLPNNTGTLAELNLAQTWSANQSVANGTELRFFSTNAANYAGFKGGASTVNLVYAMPTTDATGTQCFATTAGSFVISFTACSAGTGTPGGANTYVQYNSSGTFGGTNTFTFNGTDTVGIGLLNTTLGKLQMFGNTSGSVTIQTQAVAGGTLAFTLPNASGTAQVSASTPLVASATTGNLTCPTCTKNGAAATANQLLVGGGGQDIVALGTLGTTTTVLHGNAAGAPTFAAVNLATETTGVTAIANGGTNGSTATVAFNNLSPTTTRGDISVRDATNNVRLALGGNGTCLTSNGTDAVWGSCAAGAVSGTATSGQGTFWNGLATIGGSINWLYSASSGHSLIQGANNVDMIYGKRFTDTAPTGNFIHLQNAAANTDLFKVDVSGAVTLVSLTFSGAGAGGLQMNQGAAPALVANAINLAAPASVAASGENFIFPGTPSSGFIRWTNSSGTLSGSFSAASGIGSCSGTSQVVQAVNDNAAPTCVSLLPSNFQSQSANLFLAAPNGSAGVPTFRAIASGDLPTIQLNSTSPGGVTNTLPIANGGTGQTTQTAAFDALSPNTTQGDVSYRNATNNVRLAPGTATQLLHSGTTPSWSAVSLTADVSGVLPLANGGTNASSGLANTNGAVYSDGTKLVSTATGGAGTLCLISVSGGVPSFGSCAGSASTVWSALTDPAAALSLSMGVNKSTFTSGVLTGTNGAWSFLDGNSSSTGNFFEIHTGASSAAKPFTVTALGTANGIQVDATGSLALIGSGNITANKLSRTITATTPLTIGGGASADLTADRTIACATCVTSGSALTSNAILLGSGGGQGVASLGSLGTTTTLLHGNASGAPTFASVATGDIAANAVGSGQQAVVNTYRSCSMVIGAENGSALADADLGPQRKQCQVPFAATVVEVDVSGDAGTPNVIVGKRHCTASPCVTGANETVSNLVSGALATAASGGSACSKTGATAGLDTFITCAATLQNTSLAVGDYIELVSGTAGGTAKRMTVVVHYTVN